MAPMVSTPTPKSEGREASQVLALLNKAQLNKAHGTGFVIKRLPKRDSESLNATFSF
jgi:hypothetical protein